MRITPLTRVRSGTGRTFKSVRDDVLPTGHFFPGVLVYSNYYRDSSGNLLRALLETLPGA